MEMEGLPPSRFLFLVFAVFILCLASSSRVCPEEPFQCGDHVFHYPFVKKNSGCDDPVLRLDCDNATKMPLLNIEGYEYYIVEFPDPNPYMAIIDRNMLKGTCHPAAQSPSGDQFDNEDRLLKLKEWKQCNVTASVYPLRNGEDTWYYGFIIPESNLTPQCKAQVVLLVESLQGFNPHSLRGEWFQIEWSVEEKCSECHLNGGNCIFNISSIQFNCTNSPYPEKSMPRKSQTKHIILGCSIGAAVLIAVFPIFIYYVRRRKASPTRGVAGDFNHYQATDIEKGQKGYMAGPLRIFTYQELQQATNFFDEKNELGDGGFGAVYLGKLEDGRTVAVKRLYQENSRRFEQFINEIEILSSLYHPNLVRLYGCTSAESPMLLLVYEYVPNGTLADHLHGSRRSLRGLPCGTRLKIALQTAQALAYLHSMDPPIFHRDVKSNNILLDEYLGAKVADFGLSRLVPLNVSHITTAPQGTPGYVDPEYNQCFQLTEKSDVYSFGVVLVEIISAKVAVDTNRDKNEISLAKMAIEKIRRGVLDELVDPDLKIENNHEVKDIVAAVAELAIECLARERDFRPCMKEVVARLEQIMEMQQQRIESFKFTSISPTASPHSVPIMGSDRTGQYWVPLSL